MDMSSPAPGRLSNQSADYDPRYDPLVHATPGHGRGYAPTYWVASAGTPPPDDGPIQGDVDADVVIVGSGFTGLATALFLAREHGIKAVVLEANQVAWGCSSRNGGQVSTSIKPSLDRLSARYGAQLGFEMRREGHRSLDYIEDFIRR